MIKSWFIEVNPCRIKLSAAIEPRKGHRDKVCILRSGFPYLERSRQEEFGVVRLLFDSLQEGGSRPFECELVRLLKKFECSIDVGYEKCIV